MSGFICIHGHFYQPPRENPWLGEIEVQDSAYPYHDWNQRITAECYAPNTASRILDPSNRIVDIVNNYTRISFDFGPTLLSWLEDHEPEVYRAVLEADRESRERFAGHGSALAQAYNHIILPLAVSRDKRTQILWGIRDFQHRFGRDPEGMWLPETAVDLETLDILAEQGLGFTILAPHQAKRFRGRGQKAWKTTAGGRIDTRRPYLCRLPSGRHISLFFYDGPLAREVAFGDILKAGPALAERLGRGFDLSTDVPQLRHIATDGETFGHHHRFGEMALAYALYQIEKQGRSALTNYAAFLAAHPPEQEVEIHENTSWSCAHGVERWRADCGCHSGAHPDWSQAWRSPLRTAMDELRDALATPYEKAIRALGPDPWRLRDEYIHVIHDGSKASRDAYLAGFGLEPAASEQRIRIWKWMEMQHAAQLMYTSCGWFFDDISGIETLQVLSYAARAMQLARELGVDDPEPAFLKSLEDAPSNRPFFRDGAQVYRDRIRPAVLNLQRIGVHHAVASVFLDRKERLNRPGYVLQCRDGDRIEGTGQTLSWGRCLLRSPLTEEEQELSFISLYLGGHDIRASVGPAFEDLPWESIVNSLREAFDKKDWKRIGGLQEEYLGAAEFGLPHLFKDTKREIVLRLLDSTLGGLEAALRPWYVREFPFVAAARSMDVPLPPVLSETVGFLRHRDVNRMLGSDAPDLEDLKDFIRQVDAQAFALDEKTLGAAVSRMIERLMERIKHRPDDVSRLQKLDGFLEVIGRLPLPLDLWKSQNRFFYFGKQWIPEMENRAEAGDDQARIWLENAHRIGEFLNVRLGS
jgi:alpha-amylase/alpha-mannosidase (GH57 family)